MKINRNRGFALILVLTLTTSMLIFAGFYITQVRFQAPQNSNYLTLLQANFLGQGVAQIAALKVKKLSGHLYYSIIASQTASNRGPYDNFARDTMLNPNFIAPFSANCRTEIYLLPSTAYKDINFKVQVQVQVADPHGKTFQRIVENSFNGQIRQL